MLELIFEKLLEISIQASFFILAVILIRFCFKRLQKRYVCILWALVAVRLILPFEITSPVSLVPDTDNMLEWTDAEIKLPKDIAQEPLFSDNSTFTDNPAQSNQTTPSQNLFAPGDTPYVESNSTMPGNSSSTDTASADFTLSGILSCIWFLGMLMLLTYDLISYLRLKFRLRAAIHDRDNIWYSDQIPAPFVLGYIKPRIYVPFSIHQEQLPYIIAHEKAHISHFDHLNKLLAALLVCVYWFNPFVWAAYLLYCRDLELACDERVIAKLGGSEKKPYSEALLMCSVTNKALLQSPLSFSEVAIKDRIVNILNYKKPGFWGVVLAVIVCATAGACFLTNSETDTAISPEASDFIRQTTPDMLDKVTQTNYLGSVDQKLPAAVGPDAYYRILSHGNLTLQLYALVNNEALIIRERDTLYPLYDLQDLTIDTQELAVYKSDYDSDGAPEFALYKSEGHGSGYGIMGITMLELVDGTLQPTPFTLEDMRAQLDDRISYRYAEAEETIYISVDSDDPEIALDVSWLNYLYGYPFPRLHWGDIIDFEERDNQWWLVAQSGLIPEPGVSATYICGATFTAPVTYSTDQTFQLGDISIELYAEKPNSKEVLALYADQLDDFPGVAQVNEAGQLVISDITQDYDCRIVTDPDSGETVYIWPLEEREYLPVTQTFYPAKEYPLEIVDGQVQEVPAQILSENQLSKYAFGADVLNMTYHIHPYGTKQYILRDNHTLNVNICYEAPDHVSFQNLTFRISADGDAASLTDYGSGYYLLQLTDANSLDAFRKTYTGAGHMLPADTSQLPWDWLLAMSGEVNDAPVLTEAELPEVNKDFFFDEFDHSNYYDRYHGFTISEKVINGEVFTEFRYRDKVDDIRILTDIHSHEVISITYNDEEKPLPEHSLVLCNGGASAYYALYYVDVTGDDVKELIFEEGGGGTGVWNNYCYIFNPETMEQYPIDINISQITNNVKVTLTEFDLRDSQLHYLLAYETQTAEAEAHFNASSEENTSILKDDITLTEAGEHFSYIPETETHNIAYNPESGRIETEVWLYTDHITFLTYIGEIRAAYVWDETTGEFVPDLDTVELEGYN